MKKTALIAGLVLLASGAAMAQNKDVKTCLSGFAKEHDAVVLAFNKARSAGRVSPSEKTEFKQMEVTLNQAKGAAKKDGLTVNECDGLRTIVKNEGIRVKEMAAVNDAVTACFDKYKSALAETDKLIQDGVQAKRINDMEAEKFKNSTSKTQGAYDRALKDGNVTPQECEELVKRAFGDLQLAKQMTNREKKEPMKVEKK